MFGAISGLISTGMQIAHQTMNWAVSSSAKILNSGKVTSHTITRVNLPTSYGPRLEDLRAQVSSYGGIIPKVYGSMRLGGNVIWAADIREEIVESENIDQGDHIITTSKTVEYNYFATLAIAICEGEITEIVRIWADDHLLSAEELGTEQGRFNIHLGSENQQPDLIIGKHKEAGTYPAYRGLCYVVIEDFPLAEYGNRIPSFSFEVRREIRAKPHVEEKIKDIVLIPGAGEFVYSDIVRYKQLFIKSERRALPIGGKEAINMHNFENKANMLVALDQMQKTLPNLEWVSVVVTWFATSTDAGKCIIVPKVEFHDTTSSITPSDWNVAGMRREQVYTVLKFADGSVTYGGTPSDDSVVAICRDLKRRGLKVMLYPMIFVDELEPNPKPWRGRIKARSAAEISNWFNNPAGYNRFILHYANLTSHYIDGIVIGSEMIGLTSFTDRSGSFPAVSEFIKLAAQVKRHVRGGTIVTYAADWSEYHHTDGGWFNLDPLWASPNIDVVGIDAYFPLTEDLEQTAITEDKIKLAWESGEGWDYYWNWERTAKTNFGSQSANEPYKYAWKNLEYWWKNTHTNPDGRRTAWRPKMKPVWFTEFGFPSVDGCTNQPNVFYDPTSSESYFPRGSRGRPDNYAQRQALNASLDYLEQRCRRSGNNNLVPRRFVWTWDGRPYPEWPRYKNVWSDGILWQTGHWVNGKLGLCGLAALIAELLRNAGYRSSEYDVSELTDEVKGFVIAEDISVREVIEQLQAAYFFDIIDSDGMLKFVSRMNKRPVATIGSEELVPEKSDDVSTCLRTTIVQELELPQKISLTHIDEDRSYNYSTIESQRQRFKFFSDTKKSVHFTLPLVMNNQLAKRIADVTLYNSWQERISYEFTVPPKYAYLEPGDVINVGEDNLIHQMRITETTTNRFGLMKISAICFKANTYDFYCRTDYLAQEQHDAKEELATTLMEIIDGPPLKDDNDVPLLRLALLPDSNNWKGCIIYRSLAKGSGYKQVDKIENKSQKSKIGITLTKLKKASPLLIDETNKVTVQMMMGQKLESITRDQLLTSTTKNLALIGDELTQFERAEDKGQGKYELSGFIRGKNGTEQQTETHKKGERFVLLEKALTMKLEKELIGKTLYFKAVSIGSTLAATNPVKIKYTANNLKPFAPGNVEANREQNGDIQISWSRRSRISRGADEGGSWWDNVPLPDSESPERYEVDIIHNRNVITTIKTTEPKLTYTKQQQITDFVSYRKRNLTAVIYQMSNVVGRGYGAEVKL